MPRSKIKIVVGFGVSLCAAIGGLAAANVYVPESDMPFTPPDYICSKSASTKTFGMTEWALFSCDDKTLVIVAAEGNPADPFYFTLFPQGSDYQVFGEGTGNREATDAAFAEIEKLSFTQIRALIDEARSAWAP